jgi:hypothetical protein
VSATKTSPLFKGKLKSFRVSKCAVGRCLLATTAIRKNTAIGQIRGKIIETSDYGSEYCIDLSDGTSLEPSAPFRYLNHSCEPNCELILWRVPWNTGEVTHEIWLHTLHRITVGEELTIDYAWPASAAIPCQCKSVNCRQWIVDIAELPLLRRNLKRRPK